MKDTKGRNEGDKGRESRTQRKGLKGGGGQQEVSVLGGVRARVEVWW